MHCPGCGAGVRPQESWCSLCYRDLRPAEPLVTARQPGAMIASNSIEADATREVAISRQLNIAGIPRPSSPSSSESVAPDVIDKHGEDDDPHETSKAWPCICGTDVPLDVDACSTCGRAFLGELRSADSAARRGPSWLGAYLGTSRAMRLALAGAFAFLVAVAIPGLLYLFG